MASKNEWAAEELKRIGYDVKGDPNSPNTWVAENVLELLDVFSEQGHSGSSAPYVINLFKELASWNPLSELSGAEDEWGDEFEGLKQNKRNSRVFKDFDGRTFYTNAKVFWEWHSTPDIYNGEPYKVYFTSKDSSVEIDFPWKQPETPEYIFKPNEDFPNEVL